MEHETIEEKVIIELAPSKELKRFDKLYAQTGNNMREMAQLAHIIVGDDKEKKKLFIEHIQAIGMSRTTGNQLLKAGKIFVANQELLPMSYTNIVELAPVIDEETGEVINDFYKETNTTPEIIKDYSQKKLRGLVHFYTTEDEPTEEIEEVTTEDSASETEKEATTKTPLEISLIDALKMAKDALEMVANDYAGDLEKDALAYIHDTLTELRKVGITDNE